LKPKPAAAVSAGGGENMEQERGPAEVLAATEERAEKAEAKAAEESAKVDEMTARMMAMESSFNNLRKEVGGEAVRSKTRSKSRDRSRSRDRSSVRSKSRSAGRKEKDKDRSEERRERDKFRRERNRQRSRSRSRSRTRSRSSSRRRSKRRTERKLVKFEEALKELKEGASWRKVGNAKQAEFNNSVKRVLVCDMRNALVDHFGKEENVPASMRTIVETGEKEIDDRNLDLRRADATTWKAVECLKRNPLCKSEEDEKKWEKAVNKAEAETRKLNLGREGYRQRSYGEGYGGYDGGRGGYGRGGYGGYGGGGGYDGASFTGQARGCYECGQFDHKKAQCPKLVREGGK